MNARQKAKMYKRKYEDLLDQPVKFNVVTPKIDTLRYEQYVDKEVLAKPEHIKFIRRCIRNRIADEVASELNNYIRISTEYIPLLGEYLLAGEIKVVKL